MSGHENPGPGAAPSELTVPAPRSTGLGPLPRLRTLPALRLLSKVPWRKVLFYLAVLIVLAVALFPFYWVIRTSLETPAEVSQGVGGANGLLPPHLTFSSYIDDFTQQHFLRPLINSAIVALATTAASVVFASLAGYALARLPIKGSWAILGFLLLAGFFPVVAMIGPLFLLYRSLHFLDSIYPLILT
ncbi:MAG: carbohydrate ABC transporter permease, partial [Acidimicrobiales bacterium]|nr:carbohydrate ABC transporter permease [Acidimicrobiales bacterium]